MRGSLTDTRQEVNRVKKLGFVLVLSMTLVLAFGGVAYANFGPHGGYSQDTDACAGCHRAHTSFSALTWDDVTSTSHSALLVSAASTMEEFCYACHGDTAPGASTNVESGVFDAGPSGPDGSAVGGNNGGVQIAYVTNSTFNETLNGGGFARMWNGVGYTATTSSHDMENGAFTDPLWGAGNSAPSRGNMTCTDCHDPHGSSNYRILKDSLSYSGTTNIVGGYTAGGAPRPTVFSAEEGYPYSASGATTGWLKHEPGASQMTTYYPNYTTAEYRASVAINDGFYAAGYKRSMSTWCAGCHERYDETNDVTLGQTYDYGAFEASGTVSSNGASTTASVSGPYVGARARHRHPVNTAIATVIPANGWGADAVTSTVLPLEFDGIGRTSVDFRADSWDESDMLGCLTCHRAHGTSATMTGWAEARLVNNPSATVTWYPERLTQPTTAGVNPNFTSALLRANNRGVCERCHNK